MSRKKTDWHPQRRVGSTTYILFFQFSCQVGTYSCFPTEKTAYFFAYFHLDKYCFRLMFLFKGVSWNCQGCFPNFSKGFQGSVKKRFNVFQRSFMPHVTPRSYPSRRRACFFTKNISHPIIVYSWLLYPIFFLKNLLINVFIFNENDNVLFCSNLIVSTTTKQCMCTKSKPFNP